MFGTASKIFSLLRLLGRAFGRFRHHIILLSFLSFLSGLLEGIGINAIIPLFSFVNKTGDHGADFISRAIERFFALVNWSYTLRSLLVFITALFIIKALFLFLSKYISARLTADFEQNTRRAIFGLTLGANWPWLGAQKIGHLDQLLITDVNNSSAMLAHLSSTILILANVIIYSAVVVNISPLIALLTIISGGLIFIFLRPWFYRTKLLSEKIGYLYKEIAHYVSQNNIGMKGIKAMWLAAPINERGGQLFQKIKKLNIQVAALKNFTATLLQPVGLVFVIGVFAFFYKVQGFNFASFAVVVYAINKLFNHVQLAEAEAHALLALAPYVASTMRYQEEARQHQETDPGQKPFHFTKELKFETVSFVYPGSPRPVVTDLNFTLAKGEMLGLIGPSGAGKTTIVDLVLRLFSVSAGRITIDGAAIESVALQAWRTHIGYVSQDVFLLNDTIANNIRFYNAALTEVQIERAAALAHCLEFIQKLPQQFLTMVGERGMMLSGGERQRIALARVLARQPDILILDEATSALDYESEMHIQRALSELRGQVTLVVIAHRLSTVALADTLLVMEQGRIVESGTPAELLAKPDSYFSKAVNIQ